MERRPGGDELAKVSGVILPGRSSDRLHRLLKWLESLVRFLVPSCGEVQEWFNQAVSKSDSTVYY